MTKKIRRTHSAALEVRVAPAGRPERMTRIAQVHEVPGGHPTRADDAGISTRFLLLASLQQAIAGFGNRLGSSDLFGT